MQIFVRKLKPKNKIITRREVNGTKNQIVIKKKEQNLFAQGFSFFDLQEEYRI